MCVREHRLPGEKSRNEIKYDDLANKAAETIMKLIVYTTLAALYVLILWNM